MKKKLLSILLVITMIIGMMTSTIYALEIKKAEYNSNVYSDMPEDWSAEALEAAVNNGLLSGFGSRIMPKENLTRAQMAAIINRAFGTRSMSSLSRYTDVPEDAWYYADMAKAVQMKTFVGSNDKLNPDSDITREEVFTVLARALKLSGAAESALDKFSDKALVSSWAKDGTACLASAGYIQGADGKLNPRQNITRAEFAQLMDNILKNYITEEGTYTDDIKGNVMINVPDVSLENMKITGDLIIGDGVGDGDVTLNSVIVTGRTVIRGGGVDSIRILGSSDIQNIIIARVKGQLRVYTEDGLEVGEIIVDGNDDVIIEGNTGTVTVVSSGVTVTATKAKIASCIVEGNNSKVIVSTDSSIRKAEIDGDNSEVVVLQGASIENITVNAKGVLISGEGRINQVEARAGNLTVTTPGAKVTSTHGAAGIMAGTIPVGAGNTEIVPGSNINSGSSNNNSGSNSNRGDDDDDGGDDGRGSSPLASYSPVILTQTGDVANNNVQYGDAAAVIAALPTEIAVTLENASVVNVPVIWADTDTYNASVAGAYTFTAAWGTIPAGANNYNNLAAPTVEVSVAAGVEATASIYFSFDSTTGTITDYNTDGGTDVVIPAMIDGVAVTHIGEEAFIPDEGGRDGYTNQLTSVVIPNSVTSIGNGAFSNNYLTSVTIPDSVTNIGDYAFERNLLTLINISCGVTHIGDQAFGENPATEVYISYGLMSMGRGAFRDCRELTTFIVDPDNSSYSSADGVLFNKDQTTLLQYPYNKEGSYTVPEGVTTIGDDAFSDCTELTGITLPDSMTSIGNSAFRGCAVLTGINIPEGVTGIGDYAFSYCTELAGIVLPESVMNIGDGAFEYCTGLTGSISIPEGVTNIGSYTFIGCEGLTGISIPDGVTSIGSYALSACTGLTGITLPDSVTSIGDQAFSYCTGLTGSISIPEGVTGIGFYTFGGCTGLTGISIPDSVTSIGFSAFTNCRKLTSITIPSGVTGIGFYAFNGCTGLISITIHGGDTDIESNAIINITTTSGFNTAYAAGGAGTYIRSGNSWTKSGSSEKAITAFSFEELEPTVTGTVYEETKTIELTVPADTDIAALVATFTNSAESLVTVDGVVQSSGETANDFTSPVEYMVTAEDGTTVVYTVTVRRR